MIASSRNITLQMIAMIVVQFCIQNDKAPALRRRLSQLMAAKYDHLDKVLRET